MKRKSKETETPEKTILVGTYRKDQLEKWILPRGLYNYAIHDEDSVIRAAAPFVSELWLYAGKKDKLRFSASFEREVSADELDALGYPRGRGKPHAERYLLFRVEKIDESSATKNTKDTKGTSHEVHKVRESKTSCRAAEGAEETSHRGTEAQKTGRGRPPGGPDGNSRAKSAKSAKDLSRISASQRLRVEEAASGVASRPGEPRPRILVRLTNFKRSASKLTEIRKALAGASAAKDAKTFSYLDFLPEDLLSDWTDSLCVCEEALQLQFWDIPEMSALRPRVPFPPPEHPTFTFVDLFAGMGGFRIAMQAQGGKCVFSSEWNPYAQKTYEANFGDVPYGENSLQQEVA